MSALKDKLFWKSFAIAATIVLGCIFGSQAVIWLCLNTSWAGPALVILLVIAFILVIASIIYNDIKPSKGGNDYY